jgi:hypothetical protein
VRYNLKPHLNFKSAGLQKLYAGCRLLEAFLQHSCSDSSETGYINHSKINRCYKIKLSKKGKKSMAPATYTQFIRFLQEDLAISAPSIAMAIRHREQDPGPLPMILWQYGLITLEQLDKIYDWLETA